MILLAVEVVVVVLILLDIAVGVFVVLLELKGHFVVVMLQFFPLMAFE